MAIEIQVLWHYDWFNKILTGTKDIDLENTILNIIFTKRGISNMLYLHRLLYAF